MNAQSLLCHFDSIEHMLHDENIDILCICETWLDSSIDDKYVKISNFNIIRSDAGRGSGVCIYIKEDFNYSIINPGVENVAGVEDIWIQVQFRKFPSFIVGCVYRHPKALVVSFEYLSDVFRNILLRKKPIYILGDLNDNLLIRGNNLNKITRNLNLKQVIDKPTRITRNSSTLLDVVITNNTEMIMKSDVEPGSVADHEVISIVINIRKPKHEPIIRTYRSHKNYKQNSFCNLLLNNVHLLNCILDTDDASRQVDIFTDVFIDCLDECAPFVTAEITRPPAPWIDDNLKKIIHEKNQLKEELKMNRSNQLLDSKFKESKKLVEHCLRTAKKQHFSTKFHDCKGDSAATWKVVEGMLPGLRGKDRNLAFEDPKQKAEDFNQYFASVGEIAYRKSQEGVDNSIVHEMGSNVNLQAHPNSHKFRPQPVDVNTVILTFKELHKTNSFGSDAISYRYLKDALPVLCFYITVIVNTSIITGSFPKLWKHPYVVPVFKSGDKDEVGNYRPISLLSIVSKILEKIVATQLMNFLETNKLLANSQHGFRSNLSTETALMKVNEHIYNNIDIQKVSLLLLLDLSKAFDSVCHETLLRKCNQLHIDEFWFSDYLSGRIQSVKIGTNISSPRSVKFGVPQGSILGPILFLIYINDMSDVLKEYFLVQYADDTQIIISGNISDIDDLINRAEIALSVAKNYFQSNGLNVNEKKTQAIFIGSRQFISRIPPNVRIFFGQTPIIPSQSIKNLGIHMDQYMLYDHHISSIVKKTYGVLLFLNRIQDKFDKKSRIIIVQSLALSIINYCSRIWGTTTREQLDRVQKVQNFAAKVAFGGARKYDHVTPIFKDLQWMDVKSKITFDICTFTFKVISNMLPDWLFSFPSVGEVQERPTRQANCLAIKRTKTNLASRAITIKGPKEWNNLPINIRNAASVKGFKNNLRKHILENNF